MRSNPYPGRFIVFEGIDGSGKTTQAGMLQEFLGKTREKPAILTAEPTDGKYGQQIREVLRNNGYLCGKRLSDEHIQELFISDRTEHCQWLSGKLLVGKIVISDRYFLSTLAYGLASGLDPDELLYRHRSIIGEDFLAPDLTIVIDVEPAIGLERRKKSGATREYFEKLGKLARIRQAYLALIKTLPERYSFLKIEIIDGTPDELEVFEAVRETVQRRM